MKGYAIFTFLILNFLIFDAFGQTTLSQDGKFVTMQIETYHKVKNKLLLYDSIVTSRNELLLTKDSLNVVLLEKNKKYKSLVVIKDTTIKQLNRQIIDMNKYIEKEGKKSVLGQVGTWGGFSVGIMICVLILAIK